VFCKSLFVLFLLSVIQYFFWSLYCLSFGISFGHCIVCHSVFLLVIVLSVIQYFFWSLYCLSFCISFGHCIVCHSVFLLVIVLSVIQYLQAFLVQYVDLDSLYSISCSTFGNLQLCILTKIWHYSAIATEKELASAQWKAFSRWNGNQLEFSRKPGHIISG
jgi:hypothetical protein